MDDQTKEPLQPEQDVEVVVDAEIKDPSESLTENHPRFKEVIAERNAEREKNRAYESSISELKQEMEELKSRVGQRQEATGNMTLTSEEEAQMAQVDKLLEQRGYVKKDQLNETERVTKRAILLDRLTDKYNGTNGLPAFDQGEVLAHAKRNGFSEENLEKAYRDLHYDAFVKAEARKLTQNAAIPESEKPTGADRQFDSKFTPGHIDTMPVEDWEKNRNTILGRMKAAIKRNNNL